MKSCECITKYEKLIANGPSAICYRFMYCKSLNTFLSHKWWNLLLIIQVLDISQEKKVNEKRNRLSPISWCHLVYVVVSLVYVVVSASGSHWVVTPEFDSITFRSSESWEELYLMCGSLAKRLSSWPCTEVPSPHGLCCRAFIPLFKCWKQRKMQYRNLSITSVERRVGPHSVCQTWSPDCWWVAPQRGALKSWSVRVQALVKPPQQLHLVYKKSYISHYTI